MKTCPECRKVYPDYADTCPDCNAALVEVAKVRLTKSEDPLPPEPFEAPRYGDPQYHVPDEVPVYDDDYYREPNLPQRTEPKPVGPSGLSIAGFIVSLVGVVFNFWGVTCIVGLVLSACGRTKDRNNGANTGMATAGIALGIVGIALSILTVIACVACISVI